MIRQTALMSTGLTIDGRADDLFPARLF